MTATTKKTTSERQTHRLGIIHFVTVKLIRHLYGLYNGHCPSQLLLPLAVVLRLLSQPRPRNIKPRKMREKLAIFSKKRMRERERRPSAACDVWPDAKIKHRR